MRIDKKKRVKQPTILSRSIQLSLIYNTKGNYFSQHVLLEDRRLARTKKLEEIKGYLDAGAKAVGVGRGLYQDKGYNEIVQTVKEVIKSIN